MNNTPAWTPDRVYTIEEIESIIRRDCSDVKCATIVLLGEGMDNSAFLVDNTYIFRFPRRRFAANLIDSEIIALSNTALSLSIQVPVPLYSGLIPGGGGWRYVGYRRISGYTGCSVPLTDDDRRRLAISLGTFLKELHSLPTKSLVDSGLCGDTLDRLSISVRNPMSFKRLNDLHELGFLKDLKLLNKYLDAIQKEVKAAKEVLVHGDLYSRHLLFDSHRDLCGVIDWGDVHMGNAAVDLAIAHIVLPVKYHDTFLTSYGEVGSSTWLLSRMRAIWHTIFVALYAIDIKDENLIEAARTAFEFIAPGSTAS